MKGPIVERPVSEISIGEFVISGSGVERDRTEIFDRQDSSIQPKQRQTMQPTVSSDVLGEFEFTGCFRVPVAALIFSMGCLFFIIRTASAQEASPTPTATPEASATPTPAGQQPATEAVSPTPSASPTPGPQQASPLLPQPNVLPSPPAPPAMPPALRDLMPQPLPPAGPGSTPNPGSAEQQEMDKFRFRQLRSIAAGNPYALYLLRRAQTQPNDEMKREYMRVYYITMCDEMRRLEPRLKAMIDGFESAYVGRYSPTAIRPTIPGRDINRFNAAQRRVTQP